MAQIIKQPDGRFAIFSTAASCWIIRDATQDEVDSYYRELVLETNERRPALSFEEADALHVARHGRTEGAWHATAT